MVKIAEINAQNPWWSRGKEFVSNDRNLTQAKPIFFKRKFIEPKRGAIHLLRGPRQVGKTTYLKDYIVQLITSGVPPRDILYLSLDFFTSRREWRNAVNHFVDSRREAPMIYLLFDEITYIEEWNVELKYLADLGALQDGMIIATGSSAVKLKVKGELLPGRGLEGNEYFFKPLTFREFSLQTLDFLVEQLKGRELATGFSKLKPLVLTSPIDSMADLDRIVRGVEKILPFKNELFYLFRLYLITGGLPGVINHYFTQRYLNQKDCIEPSIAEIFVRDVVGDLNRLQKQEVITKQVLGAVLRRYGSRFSFSKISREIEKTHVTTIDYLQYMEDSFICFVLYAYDFNRKQIKAKGDKKVYFFDPFIYHAVKSYLSGGDVWAAITIALEDENLLGQLVEGMVISHLRMVGEIPLMKTGNTFLWFYYDKSSKEMDVIFKGNGKFTGMEVKYQNQVDERDIKRVIPLNRYVLLSKEDITRSADLFITPADVFLALLQHSERNL